jgi:hypothetical protein
VLTFGDVLHNKFATLRVILRRPDLDKLRALNICWQRLAVMTHAWQSMENLHSIASINVRLGSSQAGPTPPYDILNEILRLYVEENLSARDIIAHGFDEKTARWVQRRVDLNEYKREQAAPGVKVTSRAFGVGRRMPIAQKYVD